MADSGVEVVSTAVKGGAGDGVDGGKFAAEGGRIKQLGHEKEQGHEKQPGQEKEQGLGRERKDEPLRRRRRRRDYGGRTRNLRKEASQSRKRRWFLGSLVITVLANAYVGIGSTGRDLALAVCTVLAEAAALAAYVPGLCTQGLAERLTAGFHIYLGTWAVVTPFLAISPQMLGVHMLTMLITVGSRRILGGCCVRSMDGGDQSTNWADPGWDWDYAFCLAGCLSAARVICV